MNKGIKPREYQRECLVAIDETVAKGEKRALVVMASGLGKTYTAAFAVEKFFTDKSFGRVLILCHSEPILRQSKKKFKDYFGEEFSYGMYVDGDKTARPTNFLFATFQTTKENRKDFQKDEFAYIIVDEAHHSKARTYFPTIRYFEPQFLLGLTATPDRLDGQKIEEIYGEPVYELSFVEATKRGLIAECDYRLILDDLSQEKLDEYLKSGERLSLNQLNRTLFINKRDEEIVRLIGEYSAEVRNPKTMIFCKSITHAQKIARLMGDEVALIHSRRSDSENRLALQAFKDGKIRAILSVQMLNEGVDVPDANVVVFLRNTVSPAVFYQQLGRGTRLAEGKEKVLVLDFVGNCGRIKTVLELKQEIDDFKLQMPVTEYSPHGAGEADSREKFTLNIATQFNTEMVDIIALFESVKARTAWTQDSAAEALRELARSLGKASLMIRDVRTASEEDCMRTPSRQVLATLFGSVKKAIIFAGLEYERGFTGTERGVFDDETALFEAARAYAIELGHPDYLMQKEIDDNVVFPCWETLRKTYGTFGNFLIAAGLKPYRETRMKFPTAESIREAIQKKMTELGGKTPTKRQLEQDKTMPNLCQIKKFYASLNEALVDAGGKIHTYRDSATRYPDEDMKRKAIYMAEKLGRAPTTAEWENEPDTCSERVLARRHGSFNKAMQAYGLTPNPKGAVIDHPNKIHGVLDLDGNLLPETITKLQGIVVSNRRPLKPSDLCPENSVPLKSFFYNHKWTVTKLNEAIKAVDILKSVNS